MAFNDLLMKAASEYAVQTAHKNIASLKLFSHIFTELDGRPGESIAVPVYDLSASSDFDASTNNYGSGTNEVGGELINLNKHLVKSVSITDEKMAFTGINWVRDTTIALTDRITRDFNSYVFGKFSDATLTAEISDYIGTNPAKTAVAGLYALAESNDIPVDRCVVVLAPTYFAKVLSLVDYNMIGSGDYIKTGVIEGLFGFKAFVCSSALPNGVNGIIALDTCMGVASKYLAPFTAGAYPEAWAGTDEDGFTLGFRRFMDLNKGTSIFVVEVLGGAKLIEPTKAVKLV